MKPAFVKKNTEGGAGGLFWEAGEVKMLDPYAADELVKLAPGDYEIVQESEYTPEPPVEELAVEAEAEEPAEVEEPSDVPTEAPEATKPRGVTKKSNKTETPSAE